MMYIISNNVDKLIYIYMIFNLFYRRGFARYSSSVGGGQQKQFRLLTCEPCIHTSMFAKNIDTRSKPIA